MSDLQAPDGEFLIAGLGSVGRRHLRNLRLLGTGRVRLLRTFQSTLPEEELAGLPVETHLSAALAHRPAAVIISNPTAKHLEVAIPAAQAGCHLLIEKPLSHSMQGIEALVAAVREGGGNVLIGFQFRFHPGLRRLRELLGEGAIGPLQEAEAHWGEYLPNWHPWEDYRHSYSARADLGGGVVLTLCHPFDYLRWLIGEVAEVSAKLSKRGDLGLEVEDTADIALRFCNDVRGHVHLNYTEHPASHWIRLTGTRGSLFWDERDAMVRLRLSAGSEVFPDPDGFERNTMFLEEMRHFFVCVARAEQPYCNLEDGIQSLRIALAAHRSSREGQLVRISQ